MSNGLIIFGFSLLFICILKTIITPIISKKIISKDLKRSNPLSSVKLSISLWKSLYFLSTSIYGIYFLKNEPWLFNSYHYSYHYKDNIPYKFQIYYLISSAFYVYEIIYLYIEPLKKDFVQMQIHHITSLTLMYLSYQQNLIRYGVLILCLYDISDPFLEIAKVNLYLNNKKIANILYCIFAIIFIISRNVIYPVWIVWPGLKYLNTCFYNISSLIIAGMLLILVVLNFIWTKYILLMGYKLIRHEEMTDARSINQKKIN